MSPMARAIARGHLRYVLANLHWSLMYDYNPQTEEKINQVEKMLEQLEVD